MTLMGTFLKYGFMLLIWSALFFVAYQGINSKEEEEILRLQRAILNSMEWRSYSSEHVIRADGMEQSRVTSVFVADPYVMWAKIKAKLTDTEDFSVEIFFQPDVIYIHSLNADDWKKADYTHPVAGELGSIKDPLLFWQRRLKDIEDILSVRREFEYTKMLLKLKPFEDEVHGIRFEGMKRAMMEMTLREQPVQAEELKLTIEYEPNILRGYDTITYSVHFTDINQAEPVHLPEEARKAKRIE